MREEEEEEDKYQVEKMQPTVCTQLKPSFVATSTVRLIFLDHVLKCKRTSTPPT